MARKKNSGQPNPKKVQANRKNAAGSTGPKTPEGKKRVRRNATKHGLLSREVLITTGDGKESKREFDRLVADLKQSLQPVGVLEDIQVQIIASLCWQRRRYQRCETAAIRSRLDTARLDHETLLKERFDFAAHMLVNTGSKDRLHKTSQGIRYLVKSLGDAISEMSETRHLSATTFSHMELCYGKGTKNFAALCSDFVRGNADEKPADGQTEKGADLDPRLAIEAIESEVSLLQKLLEQVLKTEELELERRIAGFALPPADEAERLCRYGTAIERRLYKAIAQLEALQKRRTGQ